MSPCRFHWGSEWRAGKANQYVNLCFLRSAKERMLNDARREGTS